MVMVADSVPGLKRWIGALGLKDSTKLLVIRVVVAFLFHTGQDVLLAGSRDCTLRGSASGSDQPLPGAATVAEKRYQLDLAGGTAGARGCRRPVCFHLDATLTSQSGKKTENTFSTGNRKRRPCKGRRYGKTKHALKNCHSFTMGLLITPSGMRIPFSKPYHTREYCKKLAWHTAPQPRRQPI